MAGGDQRHPATPLLALICRKLLRKDSGVGLRHQTRYGCRRIAGLREASSQTLDRICLRKSTFDSDVGFRSRRKRGPLSSTHDKRPSNNRRGTRACSCEELRVDRLPRR